MADLFATSPVEGLVPLSHGGLSLTEVQVGHVTSLMPFRGREKDLSAALKEVYGIALPTPGRSTAKGGARLVWTGLDQVFLFSDAPPPEDLSSMAAVTQQRDGWCFLKLTGQGAEAALARVLPLDLRPSVFKTGHTARTDFHHMMAIVARVRGGFEIGVFRSFGVTAAKTLGAAMASVAAQAGLR